MDFDGLFFPIYKFASALSLLAFSVGVCLAAVKSTLKRVGRFIRWYRRWKAELWPAEASPVDTPP
jgi:hypothetical protein